MLTLRVTVIFSGRGQYIRGTCCWHFQSDSLRPATRILGILLLPGVVDQVTATYVKICIYIYLMYICRYRFLLFKLLSPNPLNISDFNWYSTSFSIAKLEAGKVHHCNVCQRCVGEAQIDDQVTRFSTLVKLGGVFSVNIQIYQAIQQKPKVYYRKV